MENVDNDVVREREERCSYCDNIDQVDGYCFLHGEFCWKIEECHCNNN